MGKSLSTAVASLCVSAAVATTSPALAAARHLNAAELDHVTAGAVTLSLTAAATAAGNFALTAANGAGITSSTPEVAGGSMDSGAVAANAVGFSPGGSVATTTTTSGTVSGTQVGHFTINGTLTAGAVQSSTSVTFVSGGTVFLP